MKIKGLFPLKVYIFTIMFALMANKAFPNGVCSQGKEFSLSSDRRLKGRQK